MGQGGKERGEREKETSQLEWRTRERVGIIEVHKHNTSSLRTCITSKCSLILQHDESIPMICHAPSPAR